MAEIASAYVSLIPSAKGFGSKMDSQLGGEVQSSGKRLGSTFGKMFAVGGALVAAAGIGKLVGDSIGEAREAQKVAALTAQVIKTTGGIANVTAKQVDSLASSISAKTGIDDEQIASASNLLLTFKDVRNEAGAGNDIFNQATKASVDMAAAMAAASGGQVDFRSSSTMLGKALNDPIKGLAAMGRVGIQFNEVQKEQITGLVESGQKMKAQKVILAELESQFGGAAAASSTAGEKASVAFGNLKEDIGTALLPAVDGLANAFIKISPAISKGIGAVGPALASAQAFLAPFAAQIQGLFGGEGGGGLAAGLRSFGATLQTNLLPVLQTMANTFTTRIVPAVASLVTYVATSLVPVFSQVWSIISTRVLPIISSLAQFFYGTLYPALIDIYTTVAQKFKPVFDQLVATIQAKVLPAADDMLKKFQEWQPTIQKVISLVVKVAGKWLEFQAAIVAKVLPVIIRLAGFLVSKIVPAVTDTIGIVIKIIAKMIEFGGALTDAVQKAGQFLSGVQDKFGQAMAFIGGIPEKIKGVFKGAGTLLSSVGGQMVDGLKAGIEGAWHKVTAVVESLIGKIPKKIREIMGIASPSKVTTQIGSQIAEGLAKGIDGGAKKAAEAARKVAQGVIDATKSTLSEYRDLAASIGGAFAKDVFGAVGSEAELDADGNVIKPAVTAVQQFLSDATANVAEMDAAKKAIEAMKAAGVNKTFLESLAASGNAELTIGLAADPMALAQAQSLFSQQQQLSKDIGASVASEAMRGELKGVREDLGKIDGKLEKQADRLVKTLDSLPREVSSALTKSLNEIARRG